MKFTKSSWAAVGAALLLAACGGGGGGGNAGSVNSNPGRGELMQTPPLRTLSISATDFKTELIAAGTPGQTLLGLASGGTGTLKCGVDVHYIKYGTVGGKGEATQASGALMVPTGGVGCNDSARPIVLFAHGTNPQRNYNLADMVSANPANPAHDQATLIASQFAANGYIVVAPNYTGYDSSPLSYHPFLVGDKQAKDMIDALAAARSALPKLLSPVADNGKLFISGISEGGYVAMATRNALRSAGVTVTASGPIEPVAMPLAYADKIMQGLVPAASTVLLPNLINGYQKTYGDIYATPGDFYTSTYASRMEGAFPGPYSFDALLSSNIVPTYHLFSGGAAVTGTALDPVFANGVGLDYLVNDNVRTNYLADVTNNLASPTYPLRVRLNENAVVPLAVPLSGSEPMMICGGSGDPTVFFSVNSVAAAAVVNSPALVLYDLEDQYPVSSVGNTTIVRGSPLQGSTGAFGQAKAATLAAGGIAQVLRDYHGVLAPTFCAAAIRGFFDQH